MTQKKRPSLFHPLLILTLALSALLSTSLSVAAQTENQVFISNLDCSAFPTISMLVRGLDADGNLIAPDLIGNSFTIYENGNEVTEVQGIGTEKAPKYVIFAIDRGPQANLGNFRVEFERSLLEFSTNYFNEGEDNVQFVEVTKDGVVPDTPSKTSDEYNLAISNLTLSPSAAASERMNRFQNLETFFTNLIDLEPGRYNMVMIYFTRVVEREIPAARAEANSLGQWLASNNITVYVVNTDTSGDPSLAQPFEDLAAASQGRFVPLDSFSAYPQTGVTNIFRTIDQDSQAYHVQFQAQALGAEYNAAPKGFSAAEATDVQTCTETIILDPPEVQITQPSGVNPSIFLEPGETTITVQAALQNWPQDGSRRIVKAELLVNGEVVATPPIPEDSNRTTFSFDWDVSTVTSFSSFSLQVRVEDQFGTTGNSSETQVDVNPVVPTQTPVSSVGPIVPGESESCAGARFSEPCRVQTIILALIWVGIPLLFLTLIIVVLALFSTNRKLARMMPGNAQKALSKVGEQIRKTLLGGTSVRRDAIAYLNVLVARADRAGGRIEIYNNRTTLGRDPNLTDIQLFNLDDESSVSGLHCTIFYDQGKFFITDDNSSNGTYLNGRRLSANDPVELHHGAEIVLGDVFRQGAKLKFEIATEVEIPAEALPTEDDFHVDIPMAGGSPYSSPPRPAVVDDNRKTVPGYRDDPDAYSTDDGEKTDIFYEPPASLPPAPSPPRQQPQRQAPPPPPKPPKKKGDDDWMKKLG